MSFRRRVGHRRSRPRKDSRRKPVKIRRPGALKQYGYSTRASDTVRRKAIDKAVKRYGALSVFRMLNAQIVFRKGPPPGDEDIFVEDREYVKKKYLQKKKEPTSLKDVDRT